MRVLAMVHGYPPYHNAGGEMTMHTPLAHLAARGHHVDVLLSRPQPGLSAPYEIDGVWVHPHRTIGDPFIWFEDRNVDVVLTHLENTTRAAALCSRYKVPLVQVIHNDHVWTKGCYRRGPVQLAVFNTVWMQQAYHEFWGRAMAGPPPPSVVIHPVVDPALYSAAQHGKAITLINLNEAKGGELFWELARRLPNKAFLGVTGAYGSQVLGEASNVTVLPTQRPADMAAAVYARTKVLLMPSGYESYGRTAIEAAYNGIPTIAHPTPGLQEALGPAGTFVDRDDVDGWVAAIKYLLSPRGFARKSQQALSLAAGLDPQAQLDQFRSAIEGVVRRGFAVAAV